MDIFSTFIHVLCLLTWLNWKKRQLSWSDGVVVAQAVGGMAEKRRVLVQALVLETEQKLETEQSKPQMSGFIEVRSAAQDLHSGLNWIS